MSTSEEWMADLPTEVLEALVTLGEREMARGGDLCPRCTRRDRASDGDLCGICRIREQEEADEVSRAQKRAWYRRAKAEGKV